MEKQNDSHFILAQKLTDKFKNKTGRMPRILTTKLGQEIANLIDEKVSTAEQTGELNQLRERITELEKDKLDQKNEMVYIDTARHLMQDTGIKTKIIKQYLPIMNQLINKYLMSMDF